MAKGSTFTNHPGIVDYQGHSYFFYHNSALPGGTNYKRSVCVEEFSYGADGTIPMLTMSTKGPAAIATLDPFKQVEAETIAFSSGLKTEVCTDTGAGMNVTSIGNGDYIKVKEVDFLDGVTSFDARVSSAASNAKIELHLDSQTGTSLGTCDVSGASSWTTKTCAVSGGSGKHDLFLKFVGGSGDLFKFNWWRFTGPTLPNGGGGSGGAPGAGSGGVGGSSQGTSGSVGTGGTVSNSGGSVNATDGGRTGSAGSSSGGNAASTTSAGSGGSANQGGRAGSGPAASAGEKAAAGADAGGCTCSAGGATGREGLAAALCMVASAFALRRRRK